MGVLQNPKHERFAQELSKGKGVTEAYVAAGYDESPASATRLSKKVKDRVSELQGQVAERVVEKTAIDKQWVLDRLVDNVERAMQAQEIMRGDEGTGEYKYEGAVANRALELIGKELGMFKERVEHTGRVTLADLVTASLPAEDKADKPTAH